jgi:hypothetical protein
MRTERETENTLREVEDLALSLVFGCGGAVTDAEIDFLYLDFGIESAIGELLAIIVGE